MLHGVEADRAARDLPKVQAALEKCAPIFQNALGGRGPGGAPGGAAGGS